MLTADLHTHTKYSHGKGTVEQNVMAAMARGLKRIAITEHGPKHLFFPVKWEALKKLRKEIDQINDRCGEQIEVLMGLEANLMGDGITDVPEDTSIFDFVLIGFHKGTAPQDALSRRWWRHLLFREGRRHAAENTMAYVRAMDCTPKLLAITHPGIYIPVDIPLLAREAAKRNVALEMNEAHRNMRLQDVLAARAEGAGLLISSDAHTPQRVGDCAHALALAQQAGVLESVINWEQ